MADIKEKTYWASADGVQFAEVLDIYEDEVHYLWVEPSPRGISIDTEYCSMSVFADRFPVPSVKPSEPLPLIPWTHWQTKSGNIRVTVYRIKEGYVRYGYHEDTEIGTFSGRDNDSIEDFKEKYPISTDSIFK